MGETTQNKGFVVNENGEIVRNRMCSHCGKALFSDGDYCEYCGAKIVEDVPSQNKREKATWYEILIVVIFWILVGVCLILEFE